MQKYFLGDQAEMVPHKGQGQEGEGFKQFQNVLWSFKTISLSPIRTIVVEQTSQKQVCFSFFPSPLYDHPPLYYAYLLSVQKLVTLERNGQDLYLELRYSSPSLLLLFFVQSHLIFV